MSVTELLVIGLGLFVGYWIVSRLIADKPRRDEAPPREEEK
jgi:hypothetical protein